jgi:hypothetical protein
MADHTYFANLIWSIADLLRGPYRPPQYERVMLPMTVLRRFDSVLASTKAKVVGVHERSKGGKVSGDALDIRLNKVAGQRFHNRSPLDFARLVDTALGTGLFSIWWTVFWADADMFGRLRQAFPGSCTNSFDTAGNLQARLGGQL